VMGVYRTEGGKEEKRDTQQLLSIVSVHGHQISKVRKVIRGGEPRHGVYNTNIGRSGVTVSR